MLFKFKSKATGDLIMLEPNGRRVLQIIGKDPSSTGIILPAQMPTALAALESAIASEESAIAEAKAAAKLNAQNTFGDDADAAKSSYSNADVVPLRQRALPFIELLKSSHNAGVEVVWGV
jgi:cyclopropane-fatty-acyl-phospholipid synthase